MLGLSEMSSQPFTPSHASHKQPGHGKTLIREGNFLKGLDKEARESAEVDLDEMIEKSNCSAIYHQLEECLGEHNREWRKCQKEVKALKDCNVAKNLHQQLSEKEN